VRSVTAETWWPAVSNAGGFGILGAVAHSPERLQNELTWIEQQTGGKPYGVDLLLPPKYVGDDRGGINGKQARELLPEEHRAFVDDLLIRYGITAPTDEDRRLSGELNISPKAYEPLLDVAFAHRIRMIASALGPAPADLVRRAHDNDVLVASLAGSTRHARRHAESGVDLIVAQGTEGRRDTLAKLRRWCWSRRWSTRWPRCRCWQRAELPGAARSLRRWRWVLKECGADRCG